MVSLINANDITKELGAKQKDLIMYHKGMLSKNQMLLKEKTASFDSMISKSEKEKNPKILSRIQSRLEELSVEIETFEAKIEEHESIINNLQTQSISGVITKDELLKDRKIAQAVIKEVIQSIEVDESTGEITITTN